MTIDGISYYACFPLRHDRSILKTRKLRKEQGLFISAAHKIYAKDGSGELRLNVGGWGVLCGVAMD